MAEKELRIQLKALRKENARLAALQDQQNPTTSVNRVAVKLSHLFESKD